MIAGFNLLYNEGFFQAIRSKPGQPTSMEEMLSLKYITDLILLLLYYGLFWFIVGRGGAWVLTTLMEWEEAAFPPKKRKFEDYHNYKYDEDDGFGQP